MKYFVEGNSMSDGVFQIVVACHETRPALVDGQPAVKTASRYLSISHHTIRDGKKLLKLLQEACDETSWLMGFIERNSINPVLTRPKASRNRKSVQKSEPTQLPENLTEGEMSIQDAIDHD